MALVADLMTTFQQGPAAVLIGDIRAQLKRAVVDLKRKLGRRLTVEDLADVLSALRGIEASRRYIRGHEYIYQHLKARVSAAAAARMGDDTFFPPSRAMIELTKTFDHTSISRTVAFLEQATGDLEAPARHARTDDLRARWERAMAEDGPGAYKEFTRRTWRLIYTVASGAGAGLLQAVASIPRVEPYIRSTATPGLSYYDVLADAPKFLRVMVYAADANRKGHTLDGARKAFPLQVSERASRALDGYLRKTLGDATASQHVFFSENRDRIDREDPMDVQACLDCALGAGEAKGRSRPDGA